MADYLPLDTTADAHEFQLRVYRRMGGAARVVAAFRLSAFVRETAVAGIRYRHPEYSDQKALFAWQPKSICFHAANVRSARKISGYVERWASELGVLDLWQQIVGP